MRRGRATPDRAIDGPTPRWRPRLSPAPVVGALAAFFWWSPAAGQEANPDGVAPAPGESLPVVAHTLDNGMRFLVLERRGSPTVAFMVHYPVGSIHEHLGNTGIAHVLEHMLFKGTQEIGTSDREAERALLLRADVLRDSLLALATSSGPSGETESATPRPELEARLAATLDSASALEIPNEFDAILSRAGARGLNATTSYEATRYFVEMPSNRAELWFALESARMKDPVFRGFYPELDVVKEERRMRLETSPGALLQTALLAAAYEVHPYGVPVIGHASDLDRLTRRQAEDYFRRYYGARNAVVAVVGSVDPDQVIQWANAYFGDLREGEPPPLLVAEEPPQRGIRRIEVEYDAEPQLAMAWRGVSGDHPDAPALAVLAVALTGGRT
ncbi:MAG: insulinase family protein, partial [Gemmatimonadetes bacterium]|nr:insulinase family protein [Gemmatimonadota bacterium]